ncbi:MAG: PepSY domain-containing protein [Lactovum sp.]
MNKKLIITLLTLSSFTVLTACGNNSTKITASEAREIAIKHAGESESDAQFIRTKLDREDGNKVYDVEFYIGATEYDYEIDADSGDVISYDSDVEDYIISSSNSSKEASSSQSSSTESSTKDTSSSSNSTEIGEAKAKEIALTHAGKKETDANFTQVSLDYDNNVKVYEVEFYIGTTEYSYEIDAASGDIRESDMDIND